MDHTILIIEDDLSILRGLKDNLQFEGYRVLTATDGISGLEAALEEQIDLILLDLMLPGLNGYEICRKIKKEKQDISVIMITARGTEMDKIAGLDIGADDYLTKPFSIPELLARVRAVLRRATGHRESPDEFRFDRIIIDFKGLEAFKDGKPINLSTRAFEILKYFISREGEVINRDELLNDVWGYDVLPDTRTVDNFILELRKKIEDEPSRPIYITTIRGAGYRFSSSSE